MLNLVNEYTKTMISERLLYQKVLYLERVDVMVNSSVITIHGYAEGGIKTTLVSFVANTNYPITKETLFRAAEIPVQGKQYITFGDIYLHGNSEFTPSCLMVFFTIKSLFETMRREFEEFYEVISYNLYDYLLVHPEEDHL